MRSGEGTVGNLGEIDGARRVEEQGSSGAAAADTARGEGMEEAPMEWEWEEYGAPEWETRERAAREREWTGGRTSDRSKGRRGTHLGPS